MAALHLLAQAAGRVDVPDVPWFDISPMLVLLGGALVVIVVSALVRDRAAPGTWAILTVATAAASLVLSFALWDDVLDEGPRSVIAGAVGIDGFSTFFWILFSGAVILAALFADDYLRREELAAPEFYALLMLAAIGAMVMASADDLIVLFLGLETLSLALYVLAGFHVRRLQSQEAALKYFVLGAFSSAFLLYGIALTYGATGSTNLTFIADFLAKNVLLDNGVLLAGMALMLVGFGFKVSAVPFQAWTPDVYQGSPSPVTGFMASAAKAAGFAALLRVFYLALEPYRVDWRPIIWVLAVLTLLLGSILAVVQTNVKRMLAYSSITHAGFVLVAVQAGTPTGTAAALFYLLTYAVMVIGTFGVVTLIGGQGDSHHRIDDYRGLARRSPVLAVGFLILLLSQAGIPGTAGFLAKFYVIESAVDVRSYTLAVIAMLAAVIASFLYLRIVVAMFFPADDETAFFPDGSEAAPARKPRIPWAVGVGLVFTVGFVVVVGVAPTVVIDFARDAVPVLVAGR